jgi:DNA-binding XRE family transcriptional regulator
MAAQKQARAPRNDAVEAIEQLFGNVEGWTVAVADAAKANDVAQQLYDLRARHGLTQKALAALAGTTQSVIARLEDANYEGHSLSMLSRIAAAIRE